MSTIEQTTLQRIPVAHVIDTLQVGGTESRCLEIALGLGRRGFESHLLYFHGEGPLGKELTKANILNHHVDMPGLRHPRFVQSVLGMASYLRRHSVKVVQTYGYYSNVPGILAGKLAWVPAIIAGRRDMGEFLSPWQKRIDRVLWYLADRVVVNSLPVRDALVTQGVSPNRITVIHNGVDRGWLDPYSVEGSVEPLVGMVATFRRQKDHVTFLEAAKLILERRPGTRFTLVGGGPNEIAMRGYASALGLGERVAFAGVLRGEELRERVRSLSVAVLCSTGNEGLPNVLLEAMAAGKPVVATDVGGTKDTVQDGITGFLVGVGDSRAVAERILWLLERPHAAREMGDRARKMVAEHFLIERMEDAFIDLYAQVLASKRACPTLSQRQESLRA